MSELKTQFDAAVVAAKQLSTMPSNATLLELYAFYKQATLGDIAGEPPPSYDFIEAAKFSAWEAKSGMTRDDAMRGYIALVSSLSA